MTVLIADDDRVQTLVLATRLKAKGFKVAVAYDAIQAWIAAIQTLPDMVILDIQMRRGWYRGPDAVENFHKDQSDSSDRIKWQH